jgi:hypothetical protein
MALAAVLLVLAAPAARAQAAASAPAGSDALARCERAVRQALMPQAGPTAELRLSATPPRPASNASPTLLQGEGQWRDGATLRKFSFSCNIDPQDSEAVGVVIRQSSPPLAAQRGPEPIDDPDLSHLSPSACESGAALALQQRWPRVSQISFDPATRSLTQQSASRAELHGQGRARPSPESAVVVHFGFDCTVDPRDGRVIGMRLSG